ncbi:UNVERIFIED_CONTAM: hypothetical protein RMT77_012300 [Armadillidium vulgare]
MFKLSFVLLCFCASVAYSQMAFVFPAGAETLLTAPLDSSFTCDQKIYGYYADVANNCEVFHVCLPLQDDTGNVIDTAQFSFVCGNQTVFSQESLTCVHPDDAMPCSDSENLYQVSNSEFGVVTEGNNQQFQDQQSQGQQFQGQQSQGQQFQDQQSQDQQFSGQ